MDDTKMLEQFLGTGLAGLDGELDFSLTGGMSGARGGAASGGAGGQSAPTKRSSQNAAAQKRCRERRKARAKEMAETVESLTARCQDAEDKCGRHAAHAAALTAQIESLTSQLAAARGATAVGAPASGRGRRGRSTLAAPPPAPAISAPDSVAGAAGRRAESARRLAELRDSKTAFFESMDALGALLGDVDSRLGGDADGAALLAIESALPAALAAYKAMLLASGHEPVTPGGSPLVREGKGPSPTEVLGGLSPPLRPAQVAAAGAAWGEYVTATAPLYHEREELHALLESVASGTRGPTPVPVAGRCALALSQLRANLREESEAALALADVVFGRVLRPMQAARVLCAFHPRPIPSRSLARCLVSWGA